MVKFRSPCTSLVVAAPLLGLFALLLLPPPAASAPPAGPMSWWGYWTGEWHGDYSAGVEFIDRGEARRFGQNFVALQVDDDLAGGSEINRALERAADEGLGVLLHLHDVLYNGCVVDIEGPRARHGRLYDRADYDEWRSKLERLRELLSDEALSAIIAVSGFDDMNPGRAFGCFEAEPGLPSPVPEAMRMIAEYFPEVEFRGHVWQINDWTERGGDPFAKREWLAGSTFVIAYSYQREASSTEGSSRDCRWPSRSRPGTVWKSQGLPKDASRMEDDLREFISFLNDDASTEGTPVLFVPPSHLSWGYTSPEEERGIGCTLEALHARVRCIAMLADGSWASQVLGFMPFNWSTNNTGNAPFWRGAEDSTDLLRAARSIGAMESCEALELDELAMPTLQGGWEFQRCDIDGAQAGRPLCERVDSLHSTQSASGNEVEPWDRQEVRSQDRRSFASVRTWTAGASGTLGVVSVVAFDGVSGDRSLVAVLKNGDRVWPERVAWRELDAQRPRALIRHRVSVDSGDRIHFVTFSETAAPAATDPTRWRIRVRIHW